MNSTEASAPSSQGCTGSGAQRSRSRRVTWAASGGMLAALGVCASCCLLPFLLAGVGLGGAWLSGFGAIQPYKPLLIGVAAILLAVAFYAVYRGNQAGCANGASCASCAASRTRAKRLVWIAAFVALSSIVFDYFEPLILGGT
jgi:mercuric ion transport protein